MQSTLVLDKTNDPLAIVSARRAIAMVLSGRAEAVDLSDRVFRSSGRETVVPYVIRLNDFANTKNRRQVRYSRRGVMVRDGYRCVYCGKRGTTIDHVVPQSKGGPSTYENCVAACESCNSIKDDHSLESLGWTINRRSQEPPSWYLLTLYRTKADSPQREMWGRHLALVDETVAMTFV